MNTEANPVHEAFAAYAAAVFAKDLDAFVAIYDENVHVFDAWGQWQYSGIEQWREMAAEWFSSLGDERVEVSYDDVVTSVGDTAAWGHAAVTFAAIAADGSRLRSLRNRWIAPAFSAQPIHRGAGAARWRVEGRSRAQLATGGL